MVPTLIGALISLSLSKTFYDDIMNALAHDVITLALASDYLILCTVQLLQPHKAALHPSQFSLLGNSAD
jgi:hypothetical protein